MTQQIPPLGVYAYRYQRLKEVILYISKKMPGQSIEVILYAVFRSEQEHFARTGKKLTGLTYYKKPEGAVPEGFYECVTDLVREGALKLELAKKR